MCFSGKNDDCGSFGQFPFAGARDVFEINCPVHHVVHSWTFKGLEPGPMRGVPAALTKAMPNPSAAMSERIKGSESVFAYEASEVRPGTGVLSGRFGDFATLTIPDIGRSLNDIVG